MPDRPKKPKQTTLKFGKFKVVATVNPELDECYGHYKSLPKPRIEYLDSGDPVVTASTLFHEMLHFISDQFDLDLSEVVVRNLEHSIPQLLRENKRVFKALLE